LVLLSVLLICGQMGCGKHDDQAAQAPTPSPQASAAAAPAADDDNTPDPDAGKEIFTITCATCHGLNGQGSPHRGAVLNTSEFVARHTDAELVKFIRHGRAANDPDNRSGIAMPPGGSVTDPLPEARIADVVAYLRVLQIKAKLAEAKKHPAALASTTAPAQTAK
jgi:mono/diheme cytochrome c family protein